MQEVSLSALPNPLEVIATVCHGIDIRNFRNIESASVTFAEGVNLLHGDNAQGKTNLLEAIYFTALGKSFRPVKEAELIRFGEESAHVVNRFSDSVRSQTLSVKLFSGHGRRVVEQNGLKIGRMSEMVGAFRVVLFCPEHLSLIQGGPELRRNYLNVALSQLRPVYLQGLQRYNKLLKERNALLKRASEDMATFKATEPMWSAQLAREAALITVHRARYVKQVNDHVRACFADMMKKYEIGEELPVLTYQPTLGGDWLESHAGDPDPFTDPKRLEERYLELLTTRHDREIGAGATLWGVHKDDVRIYLNGRPARLYASQGQQRSLALAMKLAEGWVSAYESGGDMPVFLFDDVLSELDTHRRNYLVQEMRGRQVIMTACDPAAADFGEAVHLIRVDSGRYSQWEV
ncbi:MAG: DNA replication/repair protein RecF [Clostridia bacterium]|nr:DNA replication/repair protein RecF [Clostridia bacterium]